MTDSVPEKLGKYKIIEKVGQGGFADVYKAVDTTLDRTVALKFLEPRLLRDPAFVERFQREAKLAANLKHPHIVFVHEFGWEAGMAYMAMEFLEGQTLKEVILEEGALPPARIVNVVGQIASALDYAHESGLVHRDIKPSNIMVGADDHVTVMDFGIAKAATQSAFTTTGKIFGTPEYMSPEQAEGVEEPDSPSDIYSLGVVIYEMFTGKVPFSGTIPLSIMRGHADKPPPRPSEVNPDVSSAVETVLLKALAKKREERYQSAGEMARVLTAAVETKTESKVERKEKPTLWGSLSIWGCAGIALVAALVVGGVIFLAIQGGEPMVTPVPVVQAATSTVTVAATATLMLPTDMPISVAPTSMPVPPTVYLTYTPYPTYTLVPTDTPLPPTPTPSLTPAVGRIAFTSNRDGNEEIYVMNADGSRVTRMTNDSAWDSDPSWSSDGKLIAFASGRDGLADIYVMHADRSGGTTSLPNHPANVYSPAWSPDGSSIAFVSDIGEIYIGWTNLTNHQYWDYDPAWAPDSMRIVFASKRDGNPEIYAMYADGSGQRNLTNNPAVDEEPAWSPDGTRIAFYSNRDGNNEIYVMNADGSGVTRLTNNPSSDKSPSWSPDGQYIAFQSNRDGNWEIYVMNAYGNGQTNLTNNSYDDSDPSWAP